MAWTRAGLALIAGAAVMVALVSGGTPDDPRTPPALPGLPPPFLGTAVVGEGGLAAAIDAYGDVVDLRAPGPVGRALIDNQTARQLAGTVPSRTGIVPLLRVGAGHGLPLWRADRVRQRYRRASNVLVVEAELGSTRATLVYAARGERLYCLSRSTSGQGVELAASSAVAASRLECDSPAARAAIRAAAGADRRWLAHAHALAAGAPPWAPRMYERSLLALRALTDRRSGAVAAGLRDGWAYVWPRDAGATALAFAAAGYRREARRVVEFLHRLDLGSAARFHGDGSPVPGRAAQGDAVAWAVVAGRAAGSAPPGPSRLSEATAGPAPIRPGASADPPSWRDRADYREGEPGDFLANALAVGASVAPFETPAGLVRTAGDPGSGLDAAAAWGVRPFPQPARFAAVRRTLDRLATASSRYGITPGQSWPGTDPWGAPTAWSAWSLAVLAARERAAGHSAASHRNRRGALRLLGDLRRAATAAGALPERVDVHSGIPRSTTPLAWSHAFAILTLRQLWPAPASPRWGDKDSAGAASAVRASG